MEAASVATLQERLRNHDARLNANHDSLAKERSINARQDTEIAVIHTELAGAREDIADMKQEFGSQLAWVRRGLWAAAATFTGFIIAIATLIIASGGH